MGREGPTEQTGGGGEEAGTGVSPLPSGSLRARQAGRQGASPPPFGVSVALRLCPVGRRGEPPSLSPPPSLVRLEISGEAAAGLKD